MKSLRLVFVIPRFWPLVGSAEKTTGNLAAALAARGYPVSIVTARWQPSWPARVTFRGVPVERLSPPPRGGVQTLGYLWSLGCWLKRNVSRFDLVHVSAMKHDAYTAVRTVGRQVPVVLRATGAQREGDCRWYLETTGGRVIKRRCMGAAALVASSRVVQQELRLAGFPDSRIHLVPAGVPLPPPRPPIARRAARAALADANRALQMPDWAPLAVYTGRLERSKQLKHLVAAWRPIVQRWPNANLWLAGQGPDRADLVRQIESLNLTGRVMLVGTFDEVDDLLDAADLFVSPSPQAAPSTSLLEAMAAGLPVVAVDTPGNRELIDDGREGLLVPAASSTAASTALSEAIDRIIDETGLAARLGTAARERAADFSLARTVDRHVELFEELVENHPETQSH